MKLLSVAACAPPPHAHTGASTILICITRNNDQHRLYFLALWVFRMTNIWNDKKLEIWKYNNWGCPELSLTFGLKLLFAAAWALHPHNSTNDSEISNILFTRRTLYLLRVFMGSTILVGSVDSLSAFCYIGLPSI